MYLRKVAVCFIAAAIFTAIVGGCKPPWESDTIVLDIPPVDQARIRQDAIIALRQAAGDDAASTRFIALEAIPSVLGAAGGAICKQALSDPSPEVRAAAAIGIGDIRYAPAKEKLQRMVMFNVEGAERDARTYCAVIYALHQLGDETHTTHLGALLFDREKEVRATVAVVMGKMRLKAAISPLKSALIDERDHDLKFEMTRALARCGDKGSLRRLEAHTRDQFVDEQIIAIKAMLELRSPMCRAIFSSLAASDKSPRVRTTAAGGLAALGYETPALFSYCARAAMEPRKVMQEALGDRRKPTDKQIRFLQGLAVVALGKFKHPQAIDVVGKFLKSSDPGVRIASATSVLNAIPPPLEPKPIVKPKKPRPSPGDRRKPAPRRQKLRSSGAKD